MLPASVWHSRQLAYIYARALLVYFEVNRPCKPHLPYRQYACSSIQLADRSLTCVLCHAVSSAMQGKQILQDGIGRATEIEEPLDPVTAHQFLQQPSELLKLPSELMQNLAR